MGSPAIFSGAYTKLLTSGGVQMQNGMIIDENGPKNYIKNYGAEVNTNGWALYNDGASNVPANGTGGTATGMTLSRVTGSPLNGNGHFSLAKDAANRQGDGVSYDFTLDNCDRAHVMALSFSYTVASGTFVASDGITAPLNDNTTTTNVGNSDLEVFLYDVTNSVLIPVSPQVLTGTGAKNFNFYGTFQTDSVSTSYRLILHVATASASAWTVYYDNVYVGPQTMAYGAPISNWESSRSATVTNFGSISAQTNWSRRVGDSLQMRVTFTAGSSPSASTASISLPAGLAIDSSKISTAAAGMHVGLAIAQSSATLGIWTNPTAFNMFFDGSDTAKLYFSDQTSGGAFVKKNANSVVGASQPVEVEFSVPISGWSSNVQMSNDANVSVVGARYINATSGAISSSYTDVSFSTKQSDTNSSYAAPTYTIPVSGYYNFSGQLYISGSAVLNDYTQIKITKNGSDVEVMNKRYGGSVTATEGIPFSFSFIECVAGDAIKIQIASIVSSAAIASDTARNFLSVQKVQGPSTIAVTDTIGCSLTRSASESIASGGTTLTWDAPTGANYDTTNSMVVATGIWTAPVSGKYMVYCKSGISTVGTTGSYRSLGIYLNGSATDFFSLNNPTASGGNRDYVQVTTELKLVAGDTIQAKLGHDSGSNVNADGGVTANRISIMRIGN